MSEWNGAPLNPEEPGYHWVKGCEGEDTIVFWRGHGGDTHYENGDLKELDHWSGYPMWIAQEWSYLGPVLMPDEAAAMQKRIAELEAALLSIASNTCCDRCQEAALVARAALKGGEKDGPA